MPKFGKVTNEELTEAISSHDMGDSEAARIKQLYKDMLRQSFNRGLACVVELEETDVALTVRSRLKSAADKLGLAVDVMQRGNVMVVYPKNPKVAFKDVSAETEKERRPIAAITELPAELQKQIQDIIAAQVQEGIEKIAAQLAPK